MRKATGNLPDHLETLSSSLLRDLLFASSTTCLTATFYLDIDRLRTIRLDMHNMICQRICSDVLADLVAPLASRTGLSEAVEALRHALPAIVSAQSQWLENVENVAVEIVRIFLTSEGRESPYDPDLMELAKRKLHEDLAPASGAFRSHAQEMLDVFLPKIKESVGTHQHLTALELQEALVPPLPVPTMHTPGFGAVCQPVGASRQVDPDTELVRRFTHVVVLHWQVWADLYLAPPDLGFELCSPASTAVDSNDEGVTMESDDRIPAASLSLEDVATEIKMTSGKM